MDVLAREVPNAPPEPSNRVALATVIGMFLGILCLFGMVAAYQLLAQSRSKIHPQLRPFAAPAPKPLPFFTRLRKHCTTLFSTAAPGSRTEPRNDEEKAIRGHRPLRSFHLFTPNEKRGVDEPPRKTPLRLSMSFLTSSEPRRSHHSYSQLEEKEDLISLVRPDAAMLSPWSPLDDSYPSTPASPTPKLRSLLLRGRGSTGAEPGTPTPLLSTPPAAYLNTTTQRPAPVRPVRPGLVVDGLSPTRTNSHCESMLPSPSPTLAGSDWEAEADVVDSAEAKKLMDEIQLVLEFTRDRTKDDSHLGRFVIEDDEDLDEVSLYSNK